MNTKHVLAALTVVGLSLDANAAFAADHLMKVNEVGLSKGGDATAQFVELSDTGGSEPFPAASYDLTVYTAANTVVGSVPLVSNQIQANQAHFLISSPTANTKFGVTGNAVLTVALPTDGQACFRRVGTTTSNIHCVAWGTVATTQPNAEKGASPGDGQSLSRQADGSYGVAVASPKAGNNAPVAGGDGGVEAGTPDGGVSGSDSGTTSGSDSGTTSGTDSGTSSGTDSGTTGGSDSGVAATPVADDGGCSITTLGVADGASTSFLLSVGMIGLVALARRRREKR